MTEPSDTLEADLGYDLLDPPQSRQKTTQEFGWIAAFVIFGWSPLATAIGAFVVGATVLLMPQGDRFLETIVYSIGAVVGAGFLILALVALPILTRHYHAGLWRGLAAVGGALLHAAAWIVLSNVLPISNPLIPVILDAVAAAACANVIWRRWLRAAVAARLGLLGQFD